MTSSVSTLSNIRYAEDEQELGRRVLDIYMPANVKTGVKLPMILYIHGGGWIVGSKTSSREPARALADEGYVVFAPSYTLTNLDEDQLKNILLLILVILSAVAITSPSRRQMLFVLLLMTVALTVVCALFVLGGDQSHIHHPQHIQDIAQSFRWMVDHADMYHGDVDKIVVSGHSAGGHLASLLCTNKTYLEQVGLSASMVKACIPISGVYSDERLRSTSLGTELLRAAFTQETSRHRDAFPIYHVTSQTCPFLLINAKGNDISLKPHSHDFFYVLRSKGVYVEMYYQPDTNHFSVNRSVGKGQRNHSLIEKIDQFVKEVLN